MMTKPVKTATKPVKTQTKTGKHRSDRPSRPAKSVKNPSGVLEIARTRRQFSSDN